MYMTNLQAIVLLLLIVGIPIVVSKIRGEQK